MGIGMVLGAFCTGVALGAGDSVGAGDSEDSGALLQAETKTARIKTRTLFMIGPSRCQSDNRISGPATNYFHRDLDSVIVSIQPYIKA
jgi:hypothetical protein